MSNDTIEPGKPARASLENNGGLDVSVVHVPLKKPLNGDVTVEKAVFLKGGAEHAEFEIWRPLGFPLVQPQVNGTFVKLVVAPTPEARDARLTRKQTVTGGGDIGPTAGHFMVTLRFGPTEPEAETCVMPAVLYED